MTHSGVGKRNKFNARKANCLKGHTHDSRREAKRCDELHAMQAQGLITELQIHPQYWFVIEGKQVKHQNGRRVGFKPDFDYYDLQADTTVVEDVKGMRTPDYVLRSAIFRALYADIDFRETK
jgi:hypothetical protein